MSTPEDIQHAIVRAKLEWETTADTLTQVVCLLDEGGRIVRVNRAIEAWQLGRVNAAIGRDLHDLLHGRRCGRPCRLRSNLLEAWNGRAGQPTIEFEIEDSLLGRALSIVLRCIANDSGSRRTAGSAHAVMVVSDVTPLHQTRVELEALNEHLEARVQARTQELKTANTHLESEIRRRELAEDAERQSRNELELLSQQLIKAQEQERRRISQELHDSIGQSLSAIKYSLERAAELHRQARFADAQPLLERIVDRVRATSAEIRTIAMDLRPSVLDDLGVASALEWLCREFGETYRNIAMHARIEVSDADVPARLVTTVFRCAQELLNNVAKHARADDVSVLLVREVKVLTLMVCDDGIGIPAVDSSGTFALGHGIRNLRERTQMSRGKLALTSERGTGTRARIDWPLSEADCNVLG